jgi:putative ubiquitin-RnfH superfamily antitoxin RatB of RatAB toxin-antitoxin module
MTAHLGITRADELAREACRYLDAVETFAALGADPHATERRRAAQQRRSEQRTLQTTRKGVLRWTR